MGCRDIHLHFLTIISPQCRFSEQVAIQEEQETISEVCRRSVT